MKRLQALLYKEWRDQRTLFFGMSLLCVALVVVARIVIGSRFQAQVREGTILPACLAAVVVALAVETVARDSQGRVDETLTRLPIATGPAWLAKVLFVVLASLASLVILGMLEAGILLAEKRSVLDGLHSMVQPAWWCSIAALAASCHACAHFLRRSLPAALLGIALVGGVPFAARMLPVGRATEIVDLFLASWTPIGIAALLCAAFLLGSLFARLVRRPDVLGWRRAGSAVLGVALVLGPAFANSMRLGQWAFDIVPFSRSAEIRYASPSPDGRYIAMQMEQTWTPRRDWLPLTGSRTGINGRRRCEVWILDTQTGEVREIDGRFRAFPVDCPWDPRGRLVTVSTVGSFGDGDETAERIDPATARIVESHPQTESDSEDYRYGFDHWLDRRHDGDQRVYSWRGTEFELRLPPEIIPRPSPEPGVLFYTRDRALVRYEFKDGVTRTLSAPFDGDQWSFRVSPNGRFLRLCTAREERIIDARDGRVILELPEKSGAVVWSRVPGRIGLFCTRRSKYVDWQVLLEDGSVIALPVHDWRACEFGSEQMLDVTRGWIECYRLDGTERRQLYGVKL